MKIILIIFIYFLINKILKILQKKIEKLEEYNGEFIYTYLNKIFKKEIYFNLDEIEGVFFSRMTINNRTFEKIVINIYLKDGFSMKINKKENCILFLKSAKENNVQLYEKILESIPMGLDISSIIENEIEKFNKNKT